MRILVVGAGVIGSIYGGRLALAGHEVTVLARGNRRQEIEAHGLVLEDALSGDRRNIAVPALAELPVDPRFDLVVVAVREAQLPPALPVLDRLTASEILFFLNCPLKVGDLVARYGADRVRFGFPGAGGTHEGECIRYAIVPQQPSTFGPVEGQDGTQARSIARLFRQAGFATALVPDMEAWLKSHAFFVVAVCGALYAAGGRSAQLAADAERLSSLVGGLREGLNCLRKLGVTPSPAKLRVMASYLPRPLVVLVLRRFFASRLAALVIDGHANAAPDDMCDLARDCRRMIAESGMSAPAMVSLIAEVEQRAGVDTAA